MEFRFGNGYWFECNGFVVLAVVAMVCATVAVVCAL